MATELKPCPFCGGKADIAEFGCFSVYCKRQCVEQPVAYPDRETAIEAWNRRSKDSSTDTFLEKEIRW